jgi:hypothetical protein
MVKKSKYISSAWQFNLRSHCLEEQSCKSPLFEKVPRAAGKVSKGGAAGPGFEPWLPRWPPERPRPRWRFFFKANFLTGNIAYSVAVKAIHMQLIYQTIRYHFCPMHKLKSTQPSSGLEQRVKLWRAHPDEFYKISCAGTFLQNSKQSK